jgi:hypothetical protein
MGVNMGYQTIEPEELNTIIVNADNDLLSVSVLDYIVERLNQHVEGALTGLSFEVIPIEYVSRYPGIGAKYDNPNSANREGEILDEVSKILRNASLLDFLSHLEKLESWPRKFQELMSRPK